MIVPALWTGIILAACVIPPLIVLYFLRLRRRQQKIASTLLWKKAVEDLRANAPFQRLRRSLLLLLQLIALLLLAAAVMQPQMAGGRPKRGKTVFLIDNSASMTATDTEPEPTRLDKAKALARQRIESLYAGGLFARSPGETMIIAFSDRAEVMCRFTSSKAQLLGAVDAIRPTNGESMIAEALKLARAYTTNVNPDDPGRTIGEPAALELFSDGRISDLSEQVLRGEVMSFQPIGSEKADNIAISSMSVERPYDRPTAVQVFAALLNFNAEPISCTLQLAVNGDVVVGGLVDVDLAPAEIDAATNLPVPGRNNVVFAPFDQPQQAVIQVRNIRADDLEADDAAQLVIPPSRKLRVALVDSSSFVIRLGLEGLSLESIDLLTKDRFIELAGTPEGLDAYDVIVLDDVALTSLPPGRYLSFGATPPLEGLNEFAVRKEPQLVLDSRDEHPLLRYVDLSNVLYDNSHQLQPGDDVTVLSRGSSGAPAIIELRRGNLAMIHFTFDIVDSTLPTQRTFPTLIYNAVEYLGRMGEAVDAEGLAAGEVITARLPATATGIRITGPGGLNESIAAGDPTQLSWGPVRSAGLYELSWTQPGQDKPMTRPFAVNLLSDREGEIKPLDKVELSQDRIEGRRGDDSAYMSLWPWAIGACLLVLLLEWWVYQKKAYI